MYRTANLPENDFEIVATPRKEAGRVVEHNGMKLLLTDEGGCYDLRADGSRGQQQQRPYGSATMHQQQMQL